MRTTITLEEDVALMIEKIRKEKQLSFKRVINEVLRRGLVEMRSAERRDLIYATPELGAGACKYPDVDNVAEILAVAEGEDYS